MKYASELIWLTHEWTGSFLLFTFAVLAQEQRQDLPLVVRLRGGLTVGSPLALFEPVHQHMRFFTMNMKVLFAYHHLVEARPCFASNNVIVTLLRYASARQKLSLCMSKTSFHSHCDSR